MQAQFRKRRWRSNAEALRTLQFPVYVADGWPAQMAGHGWRDGKITEITIRHHDTEDLDSATSARPRLTVTTKRELYRSQPVEEARWALRNWLSNDSPDTQWPDASRAAITLWQRARERERHAMVLDAVRSEEPIEVDGAQTTTLMLTSPGGRWTAAVSLGDLMIVIAARDLAPTMLRLRTLRDPAADLLGQEPIG